MQAQADLLRVWVCSDDAAQAGSRITAQTPVRLGMEWNNPFTDTLDIATKPLIHPEQGFGGKHVVEDVA